MRCCFEYSNDSSHIILGAAENRKIGAIGFQYGRRLVHGRFVDLGYLAEVRPGMLESDPVETGVENETSPVRISVSEASSAVVRCRAATTGYQFTLGTPPTTYSGTLVTTCTRRIIAEQGVSPVGTRVSLMPRQRVQPTFSVLAGYMFATQPVPVADAGSFNFTFEFGGGLELFPSESARQSLRLEYQVQHFSNKNTAPSNPGVDSGMVKLTYAFGR